jgi:hypothetical protein
VTVVANDGALSSTIRTSTINVAAVNDAPVVTPGGGTSNYVIGGAPVLVDAALAVTDLDTATLAGGTVSLSAGWLAAEDVLGFTNAPATMGNIAGSYNAATGVLSLSSAGATATLAQWQAALNSVTYANANTAASAGARTLGFQLSDGAASSTVAARNLALSAAPPASTPDPSPPIIVILPILPGGVIPPLAGGPPAPSVAPPPATPQQTQPAPVGAAAPAAAASSAEGPEIQLLAAGEERVTIQVAGGSRLGAGAVENPGIRVVALSVAAGVPGPVAEGDLLAGVVGQIDVRVSDVLQVDEAGSSVRAESFGGDLARLRDSLHAQDDLQTRTVVTLAAGSLSMTLVYLLWLVRGGALAASMLSAMPAWRLLDPLPILARVDEDGEDADDTAEDDHAIASFYGEAGGTGLS